MTRIHENLDVAVDVSPLVIGAVALDGFDAFHHYH